MTILATYRILVTGSQGWDNVVTLYQALADVYTAAPPYRPLVIVHGACPNGADFFAGRWARVMGVAEEPHPAVWRPHGIYNPQAGLARNRLMVELGADICLAFIKNGSPGASHCARLAEEAGIPVRRYTA
ncbi:SLOG family protein [Streptomyces sp. NPDC015131]|uniref:SLOG family protein n=1 Tax=Streptomyces sp. NPDC015131 TaxID=3364941 RepID=UPI003700CB46